MKNTLPLLLLFLFSTNLFALTDCNNNGIDDLLDIQRNVSKDCNHNDIPDECEVSASGFQFREIDEVELTPSSHGIFASVALLVPSGVADFNGDGHPDLWGVFRNFSFGGTYIIFVYLNQGDNTFGSPIEYPYTGTTGFVNLSIGEPFVVDIDSDGDLDIVMRTDSVAWRQNPPLRSFSVNVLLNDGTGNFTRAETNINKILPAPASTTSSFPSALIPASYASPDSKDLAMIHDGKVYVLYNLGGLEFLSFDMGSSGLSNSLAFLPQFLNRSRTTVFRPEYQDAALGAPGDGSVFRWMFGSDIGYSDVVPVSSGDDIQTNAYLMQGVKSSSTSHGHSLIMTQASTGSRRNYFTAGIGEVESLPAAIDFNNDGHLDLVLIGQGKTNSNLKAQVLLNDGNNNFNERLSIFAPPEADRILLVHDFDNDGKQDILFKVKESRKILIGYNGSSYPLTAPALVDRNANHTPDVCERATPGDFTGNKKSDRTVVRDYSGQLVWIYTETYPTFTLPKVVPFGLRGDTLLAGDYNGSGKKVPGVVRKNGSYLDWYWIKEDESTARMSFGLRDDTPITGYFNDDKKLDRAVVRDQLGGLYWFITVAEEDHQVEYAFKFGLSGDTPFTADMDGDGISELVVARTLSSGQIVWYALFLNSSTVLGPYSWGLRGDHLLPPMDIDGSGRAEYLVSRELNGFIHTFYNSPLREQTFNINKLFGLPGDFIHISHSTGLPYGDLSVWRHTNRAWSNNLRFSEYWDSIGKSLSNEMYGFTTDEVIGPDGKVVSRFK
jgi:hypothetical protein